MGLSKYSKRNDLNMILKKLTLTTAQSLTLGFVLLTLVGALILMLPVSSAQGVRTSFIDALFTATSAVTTTGLVVVDTGSYFSWFGQIVILLLFQIGGLGYMIFFALIVMGIGKKLSISSRILLHESINRPATINMRKFVKVVILFTFCFEFVGAVLLSLYWGRYFPFLHAIYYGIFHSVSAFCTAGFALWQDSFTAWQSSVYINIVAFFVCAAGGIGFFVLYDLYSCTKKWLKRERPRNLLSHTKLALVLTVCLTAFGAVVIFFSEHWPVAMGIKDKLLAAFFQSYSASTTTGFNTIDIGAMSSGSLFTVIILMIIGASPGGTGGGIKTTTVGLIIAFICAFFKGQEDISVYKRNVSMKIIGKAFALASLAILWLVMVSLILTQTEKTDFIKVVFEAASALGTVGLSTGITSSLSIAGKILLSMTMLIGRIGPLAIGFSLIGKQKPSRFKYAEAEILIG